jgi:preprotein translocase subunit YajC
MHSTQITSMLEMIIAISGIVASLYFLIIRPYIKEQKMLERIINSLERGDSVVTIHGTHGTVCEVAGQTVILEVANLVKFEIHKSQIAGIQK